MTTNVIVKASGENFPAYVYRADALDESETTWPTLEAKLINEERTFYCYQNSVIFVTEKEMFPEEEAN